MNGSSGCTSLIVILSAATVGCWSDSAVTPQQIAAAQLAYSTQEGPKSRGTKFSELTLLLDSPEIPGKQATGRLYAEADIIQLLGPPDLVKRGSSGTEFAYFYDRFGKRDWVVYVDFAIDDPYAEFGYNASDVDDYSTWNAFEQENGRN